MAKALSHPSPSPAIGRRALLLAAPALALAGRSLAAGTDFAAIERVSGGRLGVFALDTGSDARLAHRSDERFPFCSAFKVLAAAYVLAKVDQGDLSLDRRIAYGPADVLDYAPITGPHAAEGGMALGDLCAAAIAYSDNTAANLLLARLGGPAGLTAWVKAQGDDTFRQDRTEPTLNTATPGDPRDTTTPAAMAVTLNRLVLGDVLTAASGRRLQGWMIANTTGGRRLRAGMPTDWRIGDKTGTGENNTANDVAVVWPPSRSPLVATAFVTGASSADAANAALADVGRVIGRWASHG